MGAAWRLFVVLVTASTFFSLAGVRAQGPEGEVVVNSDLQVLSLGDVVGGGHVTWTFTGDNATLLRQKILAMYDGFTTVPRGFMFEYQPTGATSAPPSPTVNNGIVDEGEAQGFLNHLQNELESQAAGGEPKPFRFLLLKAADPLERDLRASENTEGLVGTTAAIRQNLQIRFIYEVRTLNSDRVFNQADTMFASAPHRVFSFSALEDLTTPCTPSCYPFPARGGWRVIPAPAQFQAGGPFLWHGSVGATAWDENAANVYEPAAWNETWYSTDGLTDTEVDLRFATNATLSFEHTGGAGAAGDPATGDVLLVQASPDGSTWTNLTATNDGDGLAPLDASPLTVLLTSRFDLAPWLGQRVHLRILFRANGDGNVDGPGFYLRNLRIDAPSFYRGTIAFQHVDYEVGFGSFSQFANRVSRPTYVRTPVGVIQWYSSTYASDAPPADQARYAIFDAVENPQVLFVALVVGAWIQGLFHDRTWERYRMKHSASLRASAVKTKWIPWVGRLLLLIAVLLYFFPTLLGADLAVGGAAYIGLVIGIVAGWSGFTYAWYWRRARTIPPEPTIGPGERLATEVSPPPPPPAPEVEPRLICAHCDADIPDEALVFKCACGQVYHAEHAAALGTCPNCARPLQVAPPPERRLVTVKCPSCEEINVLEETVDLAYTKCTACGIVLKEVARGYNYLIVADEPHIAYEWFRSVAKKGAPGLAMSTTFPEKLRREYGLPDGVELYWISDTNPGPRTLDPKRLDFEIMRALSNFVKSNKGGVLVLDGLEYLIVENSFDRVLKFIKKVNDLASVHDATMFVPITPTGLGPEEMTLLRKEFDKVEVIGAGKA